MSFGKMVMQILELLQLVKKKKKSEDEVTLKSEKIKHVVFIIKLC